MNQPTCWCPNPNLTPFNEDYLRCQSCQTLVCRRQPASPADFYGPDYWTTRQTNVLGHPDIYQRARLDLTERAVYWLKTLLEYKRPPGKTLEIGSGHGGFSALLQWAGFEARGLEPHTWVSEFSQTTFKVPMLTGHLADQSLEPQTLDVIIMLDVLEHLPNPAETLRLCAMLLKPDGLLMVQTPSVPQSLSIEEMEAAKNPIIKMLLPLEHLFLYSQQGLKQLLNQTGFKHVIFEDALFPYDMFLFTAVSELPEPVETNPAESLLKQPASRLVLALLDLYQKWQEAEKRVATNSDHILELTKHLQTSDTDREARLEQVEELTRLLKESEADRHARQLQIDLTSRQLIEIEADRRARLEQIVQLEEWLETAEKERADLSQQVEQLTVWLKTAEADRTARLAQINELTAQLEKSEADRKTRLNQINELTRLLEESEADRAARLVQIQELTQLLEESEADRAARLDQINELTTLLKESEADRAARLEQIQTLTATIHRLQGQTDKAEPDPPS